MKTLSILLMLLTLVMIIGFGMFYLLGFAMSFDAPGSDADPKAWGMRLLMFAPIIILVVVLILSWQAFSSGNFRKSAILGALSPGLCVVLFGWLILTSLMDVKKYRDEMAEDKEMEARYPKETYTRTGPLGTDSIIVWSSGIVAYRLHIEGMENTWDGPLGDLSKDRKTITYDRRPDTRLPMEELYHFMDEKGQVFTNVYTIQ